MASVNKPINASQKESDINRKLQLYGIIRAFQNGKVPSNDQIDVALSSFLQSRALSNPPAELSDDGKVLVNDAREVVKQAKYLLLSKNEGNLIQDFIWETTHFDRESVASPNAPVSKDAAKQDGKEALEGLRTLATLLITNGQFRKLLKDSTVLLRDIAGDAATNAASRVRPSEDQLGQIDTPAEDNTWHDAPDFSKDNLKKKTKGLYSGSTKQDAQEVASAAINASVPESNTDTQFGRSAAGLNTTIPQSNVNTQINPTAGIDAATTTAQQKLDGNVDKGTKKNILQINEDYRRRAREYFDKKMPQDRKDQTIFRLKKMILECQQHEDYSQAIETILRLAETYGKHGRSLGRDGADSTKQARSGFAAAEADLRMLIERFANGTSTSDLWESIGQIYKDADKDPELKEWFKDMDAYIRRCLLEQGFILEEESTRQWDLLYDQGRYLLRNKYRADISRLTVNVGPNGQRVSVQEARESVRAVIPAVLVDYRLSWPVQMVLSEDSITQYQTIFTLLLQLRRALYVLRKQKILESYWTDDDNWEERALYYSLRNSLLWFSTTLHTYMATLVLAPNTSKMRHDLKEAHDVDAMISIHAFFMKQVIDEACLGTRLTPIRECFLDILDLAIRLEQAQASHAKEVEELRELSRLSVMSTPRPPTTPKAKTPRYVRDSDDESEEDTPAKPEPGKTYMSVLRETKADFERHLRFICGGLQSVARATSGAQSAKWDILAEMFQTGSRN